MLTIKPPRLTIHGGVARLASELVFPDRIQPLWFETDERYADDISSETSDAFLLASLLVGMRLGLNIAVEGAVSSKLYYNISNYYLELLANLVPGLTKVELSVDRLVRTDWGGREAYTGFSAGIDSYCTYLTHSEGLIPPEFRVSKFFYSNVGSHGQHRDDRTIFRERLRRIAQLGSDMAIPVVPVDSNLNAVLRMNFQLTHTIRNVAVALVFQKSCAKYMYSATVHYRNARVRPTYDMGYADAIGVPLLSTETTDCISAGGQFTRLRKTEIISSCEHSFRSLDVCIAPRRATKINCSKCWKCLRTQLSLEVIGALRRYDEVFQHETYLKFRWLYIAMVLHSKDPLVKEIREAMVARGFPVPLSSRLASLLAPSPLIAIIIKACENPRGVRLRLRGLWRRVASRFSHRSEPAGESAERGPLSPVEEHHIRSADV